MRFVSNIASNVITDIQQSDQSVQTALQQLSSGQRVSVPSDNPAASAAMWQTRLSWRTDIGRSESWPGNSQPRDRHCSHHARSSDRSCGGDDDGCVVR